MSRFLFFFILCLLGLIINGVYYIDLSVSERYDTDTFRIRASDLTESEKEAALLKIQERTDQIISKKRISNAITWILTFFLVFFAILTIYKGQKRTERLNNSSKP